jgi:hypothetical protein
MSELGVERWAKANFGLGGPFDDRPAPPSKSKLKFARIRLLEIPSQR